MTLRLGDTLTLSFWLVGGEHPEHMRQFKADMAEGISIAADKESVRITDVTYRVLLPGDERAPKVPPWAEKKIKQIGRKPVTVSLVEGQEPASYQAPVLLVAEAMVLGPKAALKQKGFLADLTPSDLKRLRKRTREIWDNSKVGWRTLTDQECDKLIDEHGPDAAASAVLGSHHAGAVH
jgi:hypothetical protein